MIKKITLGVTCFLVNVASFALPSDLPKNIIMHHPIRYKSDVNNLYPSGLSPSQIKNAYDIDSVKSQGEGQVIAIVNAYDHPNIESDLEIFNNQFRLPSCTGANNCFKKVYARESKPGVNASWAEETALDVEWVHAIAPKAKIILVEAASASITDLIQAVEVAIQHRPNVISMSWATPEFKEQVNVDPVFNNHGITFIAASGDWGNGALYPASSPYVLAVGGSTLYVDSSGNYQSEIAWSGSGGGISAIEPWPNYQSNFPIPRSQYKRGVPDVAYNANPQTGVSVYNSIAGNTGVGWLVIGGTSAGAPQWAGITALMNAELGVNIGSRMHFLLYTLASPTTGYYSYFFNSIMGGTNGNCGYYCVSHEGYDYITGLGSIDVGTLVNELSVLINAQFKYVTKEQDLSKLKIK